MKETTVRSVCSRLPPSALYRPATVNSQYRFSAFPYTTVDFGFGQLGYHAFHAIVEDVPVPVNRRGEVAARPALVQNSHTIARSRPATPRPGVSQA